MRGLLVVTALLCSTLAFAAEEKGETKARMANLEQHLEDWNLDAAKTELAELQKLMSDDAEALRFYEGRVAFEDGRYEEAVKLLTEAGLTDKPGGWLRIAKDTHEITRAHKRAESEHFIFLYPEGKDEVLAPYALEALEKARTALEQDLGHVPTGKIRIEIVSNASELARVSTLTKEQIKTTGTIAICKFNKLMVTSPKAVFHGYDWIDTLSHEYVHLVVSQKSFNTVPIWLHEGLAKFLESRWRGPPGMAMTPSTLALLGRRVKADNLIPFEKMHPSIALLPSAEDAATAFAEVFFAIDMVWKDHGKQGLRTLLDALRNGESDKKAVERATGKSFAQFEKAWLAHVRKQDFPKEFIPLGQDTKILKEDVPGKKEEKKKGKDISFGDFVEVEEATARRNAHLGELFRERKRVKAASEAFGRAYLEVGDKYESVSNKYARTLVETGRLAEAEKVLDGSLRIHPGVAETHVQLGRIRLLKKDWKGAKTSYLEALAVDPFDPEVHLALTRAHSELGEVKATERTTAAFVLLTGVPKEKFDALLKEAIE